MKIFFFLSFELLLSSLILTNAQTNYIQFVDPFIGTGKNGHTFPGATLPFGMVQLSPDTDNEGWDWCSGYHYSDSSIMGFSHTHLSGTGIGDYGDILFMPATGELKIEPGSKSNSEEGYRSKFSHKNENAEPGYYSVMLDDYNIFAELTATSRAGFHRYNFPGGDGHLIIDLRHGIQDKCTDAQINIESENTVSGYRRSVGWAKDQIIYFYAEFSKPISSYKIFSENKSDSILRSFNNSEIVAALNFSFNKSEGLLVKVGISSVSIEGAKDNLETEIPDWDFDKIKLKASEIWNDQLSKIEVEGGSLKYKRIFYTALYHSCIAPNLFMDIDRKYRGSDNAIHTADDFENYTVFSLWDTFRAAHPLFTIIEQARTNDFINTFLRKYEEGGILPVWELAGNETYTMIGYHSIPVIVDAYVKNIRGYDAQKLFSAMKQSAMLDHFGLQYYKQYGYIPANKDYESVSKTLEYSYDDWCISTMANLLGKKEDFLEFNTRAQFYKNIFDPSTGFMRPKRNGDWAKTFDPYSVSGDFTEANAFQYTFFVPQDINGLIKFYGGNENFIKKLDELFNATGNLTGREQADITGLIGQYAHGNEPSHHMAYLYSFAGAQWKTAEKVREIFNLYDDTPEGLSGNEDCGQMSAWYVMSAMGFYSVTPGSDIYLLGSPLFDKVTIHLENGKHFELIAENNSSSDKYINSLEMNGVEYNKSFIRHYDIVQGSNLRIQMSSSLNKSIFNVTTSFPVSEIIENKILPLPVIESESMAFNDLQTITIHSFNPSDIIYYSVSKDSIQNNFILYEKPFEINASCYVKAFVTNNDIKSMTAIAEFIKLSHKWSIAINRPYSNRYTAGGDNALIDQIRDSNSYGSGNWQGYEGNDLDVIIDLKEKLNVQSVSINCLQDINSWIFFPEYVEVYFSNDNNNFEFAGKVSTKISQKQEGSLIQEFKLDDLKISAKFVKIIAKNLGVCPEWHKGAGGKCWVFADEIIVK